MLTIQSLKGILTKKWVRIMLIFIAFCVLSIIIVPYWLSPRNLVLRFTSIKPITSIAINNVTATIALGHTDGTITLWDSTSGVLLGSLAGHDGGVADLLFDEGGGTLLSGGNDGTVAWWNMETHRLIRKQEVVQISQGLQTLGDSSHNILGVTSLAINEPSGLVLVSGIDGHVIALDRETGTVKYRMTGNPVSRNPGAFYRIYATAISTDGKFIAAGSSDGQVNIWDASNGRLISTFNDEGGNTVIKMAFTKNEELMVIFASSLVEVWSINGERLLSSREIITWDIPSIAFSPNKRVFARGGPTYSGAFLSGIPIIGDSDNALYIMDTATLTNLLELKGHNDIVTNVGFSEDGQLVVSGSRDGAVHVWRIENLAITQ